MIPHPDPSTRKPVENSLVYEAVALAKTYDDASLPALRGVDFAVHAGEFIAILGPSGCGKTTMLQILGTLDEPTSGKLFVRGVLVDAKFGRQAYRAKEIGFIFQSFHLLPTFTALENVQFPMLEMPWSASERKQRARELLRLVGLSDREDHLPSKLSGGQRQRVAIARSLANHPSVLLADEPTGNLDSESSEAVMELLCRIHRDQGMTILLVTHNDEVAKLADRQIHMRDGQIVLDSGHHPIVPA